MKYVDGESLAQGLRIIRDGEHAELVALARRIDRRNRLISRVIKMDQVLLRALGYDGGPILAMNVVCLAGIHLAHERRGETPPQVTVRSLERVAEELACYGEDWNDVMFREYERTQDALVAFIRNGNFMPTDESTHHAGLYVLRLFDKAAA